jgi:UDP-glucose 4-epimerase
MRILITGGAGFIGSHLADACVARGDEVVALDDLSTGSRKNISPLEHTGRFRLVVGSVLDLPTVVDLVRQCDAVVHLAAAVGVRLVTEQPVRTIRTNARGTDIVLSAAVAQRCKVLLASTSEVYGLGGQPPFREDAPLVLGSPRTARWGYACSKALDEFLAFGYRQECGLPVVVARLFNTVGPRQTDQYGMVLPTFVRQALAGEPITVHGDGSQTRCFCDVADTVRALLGLLDHPVAVGEVVNVGSDAEVSIGALAELVKAACGSESPIVQVPHRAVYRTGFQDIPRRVPDLSKLRALLAFRAQIPLAQTVRRVIECQRRPVPAIPAPAPVSRLTRTPLVAAE